MMSMKVNGIYYDEARDLLYAVSGIIGFEVECILLRCRQGSVFSGRHTEVFPEVVCRHDIYLGDLTDLERLVYNIQLEEK